MKIRIQDNSIRFRLTIKETERLRRERRLECRTEVPGHRGEAAPVFRYALRIDEALGESEAELLPKAIEFALCAQDARTLLDPGEEGVYIRREWTDAAGETKRFIALVEKDRPGPTCLKPEAWIYEAVAGQPPITVPIPSRK